MNNKINSKTTTVNNDNLVSVVYLELDLDTKNKKNWKTSTCVIVMCSVPLGVTWLGELVTNF